MAVVKPEEVSLVDVAEIAADRAHRTATTPFGAPPGKSQRYVGRAAPFKGQKGDIDDPAYVAQLNAYKGEKKVGLGSALEKAVKISRACKGVLGIGVNPLTGFTVPQKVICQLKEAGKV